jgi:hypothetical protein
VSLLSGCAIKTSPVAIRDWPVAKRAAYYADPLPYRLAVYPLTDERPRPEREGRKPAGVFLAVWNRRVGDYTTGDSAFGGGVAQQLSEQLAAYLKNTNAFAEVMPVNVPAGSELTTPRIQALGREHVIDYVITGAVEHFHGGQHQHTSSFFLPLYFVNTWGWQDNKSLPWGRTAIRFVVHETRSGDLIWRQRLEGSQTLARDTDSMAEAALESFAGMAGQLAVALRQLPAPVSTQ